ncbi:MAG TPA: GIY-YIG nuclease family protein [Candidatus Limnocylindrales bacterium]|nr:GIY-YIG nuclease family protein [Candidatus Limnocylindrales bacterium]
MNADAVHFYFMTGRPSLVASTLRRRVSAYTRKDLVRGFKIGITNNPPARFSNGYSDYDEMIVLYKSSSLDSVSEVERDLIDHNQEITKNRIAGGRNPSVRS